MKKWLVLMLLFVACGVFAQSDQLAQNYFDRGDFEKARLSYEELVRTQPGNGFYFSRLVECHQQLQQLDVAEKLLQERLQRYPMGSLLVEYGYNFQLKKDATRAKKYYDEALEKIRKNPSEVYGVAAMFDKKVLLEYALKSYELAVSLEPRLSFNFQMAMIYGQLGNTDKMIDLFLTEAYTNPQNSIMIQNQLTRFMTEDAQATFNETLRKALLLRAQQKQDVFWNQYLSWFYVQQKEYNKAFIQEKAIYRRNPETFANIVNLANLSVEEGDAETAREIFAFILENTQDLELKIMAHHELMKMRIASAQPKDFEAIAADLDRLLKEFGASPYTLLLQIQQANFTAFNLKKPEQAREILKKALDLQLSRYQQADVKMELADILLLEEKYNQALIYYSQIEEDLKNDVIGHEASLKSARTSYFKGDFDWAQKQFRALKSASTQLIANDALEYFLLINDNTAADSTQAALKRFARADYLRYQHKRPEALLQFQGILKDFKGQEIEAVTLLRLGKTYEEMADYPNALKYYQEILDHQAESIYVDEALYFSAEIYSRFLQNPEKAKALYEKVLFNHQDSIYFVEARKKFRQLRGDNNL